VRVTSDDYLAFIDITLDGYRWALARLDDTTVNQRPEVEGANSPYALITHATGACRWWLLHITIGQPTDRVRDDEFLGQGPVSDLTTVIDDLQRDLHQAGPQLDAATELAVDPGWSPEGWAWTVGSVAMHAYEELAQHLGHLELTVDLVAPRP